MASAVITAVETQLDEEAIEKGLFGQFTVGSRIIAIKKGSNSVIFVGYTVS